MKLIKQSKKFVLEVPDNSWTKRNVYRDRAAFEAEQLFRKSPKLQSVVIEVRCEGKTLCEFFFDGNYSEVYDSTTRLKKGRN